jgi:hypothetical protein
LPGTGIRLLFYPVWAAVLASLFTIRLPVLVFRLELRKRLFPVIF